MTSSVEELKEFLSSDEPDYKAAISKFGQDALPHLEILSNSDDTSLASKAISLSSMINDIRSVNILKNAANKSNPILRVTAAAGARNFISKVDESVADINIEPIKDLLLKLKDDPDPGVSRQATKTLNSIIDTE